MATKTSYLIQTGILAIEESRLMDDEETAKVSIRSEEVKILLYRLLLAKLRISRNSLETIQFFRQGNFKTSNKYFDEAFLSQSKLELVELHESVYIQMTYALLLSGNLPYVKVQPFKIEDKEGILVIDEQTQRAWLIALCFVRIKKQMHRQNLYSLEKMKGFNLSYLNLSKVKRLFKLSIAFFVKTTLIFCIEAKDSYWRFSDKKNTVANDIVIKSKYLA